MIVRLKKDKYVGDLLMDISDGVQIDTLDTDTTDTEAAHITCAAPLLS